MLKAEPNGAHLGLAQLENDFDVTIITQNIDDLHERAGSTKIVHLHGEIFKMRSERSYAPVYEIKGDIQLGDKAPDGGQLRPHIVWFGEAVPMIELAADIASAADFFAVIGTSLVVYPAAGLLHYTKRDIPKFIVDKVIPSAATVNGITSIQKPASEGVPILSEMLRSLLLG